MRCWLLRGGSRTWSPRLCPPHSRCRLMPPSKTSFGRASKYQPRGNYTSLQAVVLAWGLDLLRALLSHIGS